jgi:hypothetical protein
LLAIANARFFVCSLTRLGARPGSSTLLPKASLPGGPFVRTFSYCFLFGLGVFAERRKNQPEEPREEAANHEHDRYRSVLMPSEERQQEADNDADTAGGSDYGSDRVELSVEVLRGDVAFLRLHLRHASFCEGMDEVFKNEPYHFNININFSQSAM